MATTTTYYGFDIPQSSDLVKDGATAIATLGQDIDTAMNTALGTKKSGLVLLNTQTFSAVSSFSFPNDTFTSTYDNYVLMMRFTTSSNAPQIAWRGRIAGTDTSLSNYQQQNVYFENTATTGLRSTNQSSGTITISANPGGGSTSYIYSPKLSQGTGISTTAVNYIESTSIIASIYGSSYSLTTAFDSITILVSTGTMTGTASMYGAAK